MEVFRCAHTDIVELEKLVENPKNPNKHPGIQIDLLSKIINFQGQRSPIVVSKRSGFITKGHGRLMALKKLGWKTAAVDYQEYETEAQEFADVVADNKIAELADHDDAKMIQDLKEMNFDLDFDLLGIEDFSLTDEEKKDEKSLNQEDLMRDEFIVMLVCRNENIQAEIFEELKERDGIECKLM